ncbi:cysteine-rich RLK (RECEPTOR-like protein kinase) 25 [Hibiscus trionum]|uniref:Cysteine-rich RLK (RECEPTOR-like protein kinase) 25 n=1 Tax=Hibiscus trionum TaxID=183268 RepID=A0A9W7IF10_HIBTR|nr:cysteine-rich RLK (RECEPTOR-like protein kinase) 25 [Hibiscus trionum]
MVYGLFLCRGDLSTDVCQACVTFSANDISQRCHVETTAVIWYDECLLRYSNRNIFSVVAESPTFAMANTRNAADLDRFNWQLQALMNDTATEAANAPPGAKKFAIRQVAANFSSALNMYALGQCTPDLSSMDCDSCLRFVITNLPGGGSKILGQRNSNFYQTEGAQDLIGYAWKLWKDERPLELLKPVLRDNYSGNEVVRCIQLGLLCVQEDPADRPTMATIVLMLSSYSVTL